MRPSIRKILGDSHVAAVAVGVLIFLSVRWIAEVLPMPVADAVVFLASAVAVRGMPSESGASSRFILATDCLILLSALVNLAAAWLLSRWVYGEGPLQVQGSYPARFRGRRNV